LTTYLAGVISFIATADGFPNGDYGDATGFGRVSPFVPWILDSVPEPSAFSLLGVGLGMRCWRRTRGGRRPVE
jgi:hypothetical protein